MREQAIRLPLLVTVLFLGACRSEGSNNDDVGASISESPYLGQEPPGSIPEAFAPGLVSTDGWEYGGVFTPDLKEFYFIRDAMDDEGNSAQEFVLVQEDDGEWRDTVISARVGQPAISPDGRTMHLGRRYKERDDDGVWSELKALDAPFDGLPIMRLTASSSGTYFFDEFKRDFTGDIRYSRLVDGEREEPKRVNDRINTGRSFHPFIAPDESYLIFDSKREDGFGDSDLYISFREEDGAWGDPVNLGEEVNTDAWEAAATVTPDGKCLFFNRNVGSDDFENVDIYWVSAEVLERLRPDR